MAARIVFAQQLGSVVPSTRAGDAAVLLDLGFPCHLKCPACPRGAPTPRLYHEARRRLLAEAASPRARRVRAVFFGGDVFALPRSFGALLLETAAACARQGLRFEGLVLSDGACWSSAHRRWFAAFGVRQYQVVLDGPPEIHDRLHPTFKGNPSFERIVHSLKYHREDADVVVRTDAALGVRATERLADILDDEGLFAQPHPITLFAAPRAPYREQARDLLRLRDLAELDGSCSSRGAGAAHTEGRAPRA